MFSGVLERFKEELIARLEEPESKFRYLKPMVEERLAFYNYKYPQNTVNWSGGRAYNKVFEDINTMYANDYLDWEKNTKLAFFIQ